MKKSIITLALALVASIGANATTQYGFSEIDTEAVLFASAKDSSIGATHFSNEETIQNPEVYIKSTYVKSHDELVKCQGEIIEAAAQEIRPLVIERTDADVADENIRIVDGILPEVAPLDFGYIDGGKRKLPNPELKLNL